MATSIQDLHHIAAQLRQFQEYTDKIAKERGFNDESIQDRFMLLVEEVGELAKSMRPIHGVKIADDSFTTEIEHELADVVLLAFSLSNSLKIDLISAIISKEEKNRQRSWK